MLTCQKSSFSLPPELHYLNCAYMAPLSRRVEAAGIDGVRRRLDPSRIVPGDFFPPADEIRRRFAELVNVADPRRVALVPAVSYGMGIVARNASVQVGQTIVVSHEQFPSNVYAWRRLAARTGAELRTVAAPDSAARGEGWNARLLEAIDECTALVALPHVHWTDGTRFDLERIGERAREVGAMLIVDGTQSVGALPFDVERVRPDALVCAGYKWIFGPYGMGVAYLGPRFDGGEPLEENWINRLGSEDFGALVEYRDEYQPHALRYDVGERSNPILLPMLSAALEQISEWGAVAIQQYCAALTRELIAEARELGYAVEDEAWRGAHLFGLRLPAGAPMQRVQEALARRNISVSVRGTAVRVAPHVYNDEADVGALRAALREAMRG
jgi:selenocysteine lyase/cysteine desulfurase